MPEETKKELEQAAEDVAKQVDGKTQEELQAMEVEARAELQKQMMKEAKEYVFNVMKLEGQFSEEAYDKAINALHSDTSEESKSIFSNFTVEQKFLNENALMQGYGNFGKPFIDNIVDQDIASVKVLLETAVQGWLDLRYELEELNNLN